MGQLLVDHAAGNVVDSVADNEVALDLVDSVTNLDYDLVDIEANLDRGLVDNVVEFDLVANLDYVEVAID